LDFKASIQLQEENFLGFIPYKTDRAHFRNAMELCESAATGAIEFDQNGTVMNFHLCNSFGTPFEVKAAYTCVLNESGHAQYILGISRICKPLGNPHATFGGRKQELDTIHEGVTLDGRDIPSTTDDSWSSGQIPKCASKTAPDCNGDSDAIMEIKSARPCTITCASPEVEKLLGMTNLKGKPFVDSIIDADAFCWWLEEHVNRVSSEECPEMQDFFGTQILRRDKVRKSSVKATSVILVVYFPHPHDSHGEDTVDVIIAPWKRDGMNIGSRHAH